MKRFLSFVTIMACSILYSKTTLAACGPEKAKRAEELTSSINSFDSLHDSFVQYGECDDGAIGEGYSDAITRLLISEWSQINILQRQTYADRGFRTFVLKHVDELMSPKQINAIDKLTRHSCPKEAADLCTAIRRRIDQVRTDVKT